jgi:hypothetical protein
MCSTLIPCQIQVKLACVCFLVHNQIIPYKTARFCYGGCGSDGRRRWNEQQHAATPKETQPESGILKKTPTLNSRNCENPKDGGCSRDCFIFPVFNGFVFGEFRTCFTFQIFQESSHMRDQNRILRRLVTCQKSSGICEVIQTHQSSPPTIKRPDDVGNRDMIICSSARVRWPSSPGICSSSRRSTSKINPH